MGKIKNQSKKFEHLIYIYSRLKIEQFRQSSKNPSLDKKFALVAVVILLSTSVFWSIQGAIIQSSNADQIVDPYLFSDSKTFDGATFPSAHSLIIKWPLFWLTKFFGVSHFSLGLLTVFVSLITVSFLAFLLYKIERRMLYFGILCLALASVLLIVPPEPYPGALLPVNMAMLTTRNLEYVVYVGSLIFLLRSPKIKSYSYGISVFLMSLLIASDKLFLIIGLGGAILATLFYGLRRENFYLRLSKKWLGYTLISAILAAIFVLLINSTSVTHIGSQGELGSFGFEFNAKNILLGILYGILGILTNFGANPAYDSTIVSKIPSTVIDRLFGFGGLEFIVNFIVLAAALWASCHLLNKRLSNTKIQKLNTFEFLGKFLIFSSLAAILAFVLSNHYYAVDARYLTISLFAGFVALALFIKDTNLQNQHLILAGEVMILGIIFGFGFIIHTNGTAKGTLRSTNDRNTKVVSVVKQHNTQTLVGDYWRVLPIKLESQSSLNVMPTSSCSINQDTLSSKAWEKDLTKDRFAYLFSYDKSLTGYKNCNLEQVINAYGRPNSSALISGTIANPNEQVLFYDNGSKKSSPNINPPSPQLPATISPINLNKLPNTNCQTQTVVVTVAHQDDDLLFMNPDIQSDIRAGKCIRVIYFTAGDAGSTQFYWLGRELGSEAAYSEMLGTADVWVKRIVRLDETRYIRVDNPRGNSRISLIFMRLPDGGRNGSGFRATNFESIEKLMNSNIGSINSVDSQSSYSQSSLVDTLVTLMRAYTPAEIKTQATFLDKRFMDHSDHMAVSRITSIAWQDYDSRVPITHYIGYPIYARSANVFGNSLKDKESAFFAYAKFDKGVCDSEISCKNSRASYGNYLERQYANPE